MEHRPEPLNAALNVAVWTLANRCHPAGWDVADKAPETLEELTQEVTQRGRMTVWSGGSDGTVYADRETNWAARAWHDWAHWRYQLPFTLEGETATAFVQVAHLVDAYGDGADVVEMAALLLGEVVGQAAFYEVTGTFPPDQFAFTQRCARDLGETWAGYLVSRLGPVPHRLRARRALTEARSMVRTRRLAGFLAFARRVDAETPRQAA